MLTTLGVLIQTKTEFPTKLTPALTIQALVQDLEDRYNVHLSMTMMMMEFLTSMMQITLLAAKMADWLLIAKS